MSKSVTFASYNILNPFHAIKWVESIGINDKGLTLSIDELAKAIDSDVEKEWQQYSNWQERLPIILKNIEMADIVCLQEISKKTIEEIEKKAIDQQIAAVVYHSRQNVVREYGNAILYNPKIATLQKSFEIKHESKSSSRSAACAIFEIHGKVFKVISIHLKGYDPIEPKLRKKLKSKRAGFKELQTYISEIEKNIEGIECIVVGGDFNEDIAEAKYDSFRLGYMFNNGYIHDGNMEPTEPQKNRRIDWLFFKFVDNDKNIELTSLNLEKKQRKASDHLMTGSSIEYC